MEFLGKEFVTELMENKYPTLSFDPPVACTFNLDASNFGNNLSTLIKSVLGTDQKAGLCGQFKFTFLKEPVDDRSYELNIGITDWRQESFSLITEKREAVTEVVAKELIKAQETIVFDYPFLEVLDISGNWDAAAFIFVSINFVGWKITLGNPM